MSIELLPAIDLLDGKAIRLVEAQQGTETFYGDPLDAARGFAGEGARWLHVVDLDAAFGRGPRNRRLVAEITAAVSPVAVEASGGVRGPDDLEALLELGVARVVIGTAALEEPGWVEQACTDHGERVAVGLDARGRVLQARGWSKAGGDLFETIEALQERGCRRFVYTEVSRDGTLAGPAITSLEAVLAAARRPVVASGGVGGLEDLRALAALAPAGLEGVIVGKALYAGKFTLGDALEAVAAAPPAE